MKSIAAGVGSLLAGATVGAVLMLTIQGFASDSRTPQGAIPTPSDTSILTAPAMSESDSANPTSEFKAAPLTDQVLLVWTPGGLPEGFADAVADLPGVSAVTAVLVDLVHLTESRSVAGTIVDQPTEGFVIPLELMGFDPATYPAFLSKKDLSAFMTLSPGEIILGSTSAEIRRLAPGGVLVLEDGSTLTVSAIVDDVLIGAAEAALPANQAGALGVSTERYLLIRHSGTRKDIESSVRALLPDGMGVRIRAPGETPVLRHGDAVLPQVLIKKQFGEFAYRPGNDLKFDIDPAWVEANIVTEEIAVLGLVTCHRNLLPALAGAMGELEERNLAFLIDPEEFGGCFNPRYIANRRGISRHAWGAAADINIASNPEGLESIQDPRFLEIMERWGFTSGHEWLIPDPGHFEFLRPAQGE